MTRPVMLLLSFSEIHRDPRVLRQLSLFARDYRVITCGYGPAPRGVTDHIEVPEQLRPWRASFKPVAVMLNARMYRQLYFGAPRVKFVRAEVARRGGVDIALANDVLAVPTAVALEPRLGIHADLHEYAPGQGHTRNWKRHTRPFVEWACRRYLPRVDSASTVSPGIADRYRAEFGLEADVVPNAARYRPDLAPTPTTEPVRIVHAGAAGRARRIETMIDAVVRANAQTPGRYLFDLYLQPGDATYIRELAERAGDPRVTGVRVREPVPFESLVPTMHGYDVGMFVCPPATFNLRHSLPNKIFEFVQARLALVVSPLAAVTPIVDRHGLGIVTDGDEIGDVVRALEALTPAAVDGFKAASHAAASVLSAEELSRPWVESIAALATGHGR